MIRHKTKRCRTALSGVYMIGITACFSIIVLSSVAQPAQVALNEHERDCAAVQKYLL